MDIKHFHEGQEILQLNFTTGYTIRVSEFDEKPVSKGIYNVKSIEVVMEDGPMGLTPWFLTMHWDGSFGKHNAANMGGVAFREVPA